MINVALRFVSPLSKTFDIASLIYSTGDVFLGKRSKYLRKNLLLLCSIKKLILKISHIHLGAPVFEFLFNNIASLKTCTFIKKRLERRCFPVTIEKLLIASFLKTSANGCFFIQNANRPIIICLNQLDKNSVQDHVVFLLLTLNM